MASSNAGEHHCTPGRAELHIDHRTGDGGMDGFDAVEIFGWCRAAGE